MLFTRFAPLAFLTLLAGPPRQTPLLTISVSSDPVSASAPIRVFSSAGRTNGNAADTLRIMGTAEFSTKDPVFVATFIADSPSGHVSVSVREDGTLKASGVGEAVIVIRTPLGAQLQAMAVPAELRRAP